MELDNLKLAWQSIDSRVTSLEKVQVRGHLNRLKVGPVFELIVGVLCSVWSGDYLAEHTNLIAQKPLGAIPAVIVFILALATINLSIRQWMFASQGSLCEPVVLVQKRLTAIRRLRVKSTKWFLAIGTASWFVFPLFLLQTLGAYDVVYKIDVLWLLGNVATGVVVGMLLKRFTNLDNIFAGQELIEAERFLAELDQFASVD